MVRSLEGNGWLGTHDFRPMTWQSSGGPKNLWWMLKNSSNHISRNAWDIPTKISVVLLACFFHHLPHLSPYLCPAAWSEPPLRLPAPEVRMPMVATGSGAIDVMSKLLQDRILMLNGQVPGRWWMGPALGCQRKKNPAGNPKKKDNKKTNKHIIHLRSSSLAKPWNKPSPSHFCD